MMTIAAARNFLCSPILLKIPSPPPFLLEFFVRLREFSSFNFPQRKSSEKETKARETCGTCGTGLGLGLVYFLQTFPPVTKKCNNPCRYKHQRIGGEYT
jgi:hypothetical protein